jgi:hypothetical protein
METVHVWHDLAPDHGVLELQEWWMSPGPPLEIRIVQDSETGGTAARWEDDHGTWLLVVDVGKA